MRLLLLGGTAFLGREVAAAALRRQHDVVCLARGESGTVPDGASLVRADRDHDDALAGVAGEHWDAVIDLARQPGHVRRAGRDLGPAAEHMVFVSTGNVYADTATRGLDESAPLLSPLADDFAADDESYGPGKVACELAVLEHFGAARSTIARAGLIGGPGDSSARSGYWPWRFAHPSAPGGPVLVPEANGIPAQLIDVRDLAAWLVHCAERRIAGAFNACGERSTLAAMLDVAREVAGFGGALVEVSAPWLAEHDVHEWAGPRSLPMWLLDPQTWGFVDRDVRAARSAGLTLRRPAETLRDVLAYEETRVGSRGAGLTDEQERDLLSAYADTSANVRR